MINHGTAPQWKRVRLGPLPNVEMARAYKVTQRWADAVFVDDDTIHIVEAKMYPDASAFGQLELYATLIRDTPEFSAYTNLPVKLIFLTTKKDNPLFEMATQKGIAYEIYNPEWVEEYLKKRFRLGVP